MRCNGLLTIPLAIALGAFGCSCSHAPDHAVAPVASAPPAATLASPSSATPSVPEPKAACLVWDEVDCRARCEHGSSVDCWHLAEFYRSWARGAVGGPHPSAASKHGLEEAYQRAITIDTLACTQGQEKACAQLHCESGAPPGQVHVPKDVCDAAEKRAKELREARLLPTSKRCDSGAISACEQLLSLDNAGPALAQIERYRRVRDHYQAACIAGEGGACMTAASYLDKSRPATVEADWPRESDMLQRGCDSGLGKACKDLSARMVQVAKAQGRALSAQDQARAEALLRKALSIHQAQCADGVASACYALGEALSQGQGIPVDERRAYDALSKGCDLGSNDACELMISRFYLAEEPPTKSFTVPERAQLSARIDRALLKMCKTGETRDCYELDSGRFEGKALEEVETLAKQFCRRYDYPGVNCGADTDYHDRFCRSYCDENGMHLPE